MFKRVLNNKVGVTILEGLIALGLLALVAGGSFAVLLSVSRQSSQPDIREEMAYAVEKANDELQLFTKLPSDVAVPTGYPKGLCDDDETPLKVWTSGDKIEHNIDCRLPPLCDVNQDSHFKYFVYNVQTVNLKDKIGEALRDEDAVENMPVIKVQFEITCNGYKL